MSFSSIANNIVKELETNGVKSFIWHAATTGSVYIRFECVNIGSIRIGDHDGRSKLRYKYNVRSDIKKSYWDKEKGIFRFYISSKNWTDLIPEIVKRYNIVRTWDQKRKYFIPVYKRFKTGGDNTTKIKTKIIIENIKDFEDQFKPSENNISEEHTKRERQAYNRINKELEQEIEIYNGSGVFCVNYDDEGSCQFECKSIGKGFLIAEYIGTAK